MAGKIRADLTGLVFNRLTAVSYSHSIESPTWKGSYRHYYLFLCECGVQKTIDCALVKRGIIKSCGCYRRQYMRDKQTIHGYARTIAYRAWVNARERCNNPDSIKYKDYGGRGITFAKIWDDFEVFIKELGPKPSDEHSLDRIDNNGNYEPGNCRWATALEQALNRRDNSERRKLLNSI